jgi:quinol monooxygenase YgiN
MMSCGKVNGPRQSLQKPGFASLHYRRRCEGGFVAAASAHPKDGRLMKWNCSYLRGLMPAKARKAPSSRRCAVSGPTRQEQGCVFQQAYRSMRDSRLFYVHSRWRDEQAFELHAKLPHTVRFIERMQTLIDHPLEVARTLPLD